jgi:ketosteroid isomerase-like protein
VLELRPSCERCGAPLPPGALDARICTFECTFCAGCADGVLGGVCPNCSGELVARPVRPASLLTGAPPSSEEVRSEPDLDAHRQLLARRDRSEDHAGTVLARYAAAWLAGDLDALISCYADDFTLHYAGTSAFAGTHRGRDEALATMAAVSERAPRELVAVDEILVGDAAGALVVRERLRRDGRTEEIARVLRYRVADGLLAECWLHEADQRLVDELWA